MIAAPQVLLSAAWEGTAGCPTICKCLLYAPCSDLCFARQRHKGQRVWGPRLTPMWTARRITKGFSGPQYLHWACSKWDILTGHSRAFSERVGPLVFLVDWNLDCCPVPRCHSRRYCNILGRRWDPAPLAPDGAEQGGNSQPPPGVKPTT